ncbi:protein root UVB sensitive 6-like [Salvia hispanica]|uniref:protein root UVB sensitive 6-like n=1 Tax=Salvia hispanica TaxID=49212 RepID=UPI0020090260|nr:protein root UVB sensitive 6-like [Salvia hispanica]
MISTSQVSFSLGMPSNSQLACACIVICVHALGWFLLTSSHSTLLVLQKERYIVTYNPSKGNIYALFKDQAKSDDILKAAFHAHVLLHIVQSSNQSQQSLRKQDDDLSPVSPSIGDLQSHIAESYKLVSALYGPFKTKVKEQVRHT